jgi:hypothetical protein
MAITVTITEPIEITDASYECAAWWKTMRSDVGSFELKYCKPEAYRPGYYIATLPASVVADNFQSLYCGNAIGRAYDTKQNAGQRCEFTQRFEIDEFTTDKRFNVTPETLSELCDTAERELNAEYAFELKWLKSGMLDAQDDIAPDYVGDPISTSLEFLAKTIRRVQAVRTFRTYTLNRWAHQARLAA